MPDFNQLQVDSVIEPLSTTSSNSLLQDADPSIFYALDFWTWVINYYPGPRLVQAWSAAGLGTIATAVLQSYPYEPTPEFLETQFKFPALFAWRTEATTEQWTASFDHDIIRLNLLYVLPPLDAAASERILPIFNAVAKALRRKTSDGADPNYTPPGGSAGQSWVFSPFANLQEVGFGGAINRKVAATSTNFYRIGHLEGTGSNWFPALMLTPYFIEKDDYNPTVGGVSQFAGADITGNVAAADGTKVLATSSTVSQASTQLPPTITSLSVATGPAAGGTSVTITGTLFLSGPPTVFFGPAYAPTYAASVTYNSPTSLTVTTPAMQGNGVVDVTVLNRDGQSGTLAQSFTFT